MIHSNLINDVRSALLQSAQEAARRAYAPYSNFRVGAAVLTEKGNIFCGCNVENASYGLTICAEQVAVFSAVAHEGGDNMRIRALAVLNEQQRPCSPCGACRQVILEFGPDAIILFQGRESVEEMQAAALLPEQFPLR